MEKSVGFQQIPLSLGQKRLIDSDVLKSKRSVGSDDSPPANTICCVKRVDVNSSCLNPP